MNIYHSGQNSLTRARLFLKDQRGNVAILFGIALLPVTMLAGVALDYASAYRARDHLQKAADAGALAAVALRSTSTKEKQTIEQPAKLLTRDELSAFFGEFRGVRSHFPVY